MSIGKTASLGIAFVFGAGITLLGQGGERPAYAQNAPEQMQVSSTAAGSASTAWIVDNARRRVTFCRQTAPNGAGEQLLSFACKSIPLP